MSDGRPPSIFTNGDSMTWTIYQETPVGDPAPKANFSQRQAMIMGMLERGCTLAAIAEADGCKPKELHSVFAKMRAKLGRDLPGAGHMRTRNFDAEIQRTMLEQSARVREDIASGKRCPRCWLEAPCEHESIAEHALLRRAG